MSETETITVTLSKHTHGRLTSLGRKNESYDAIVSRVLDFWDANHQRKE